MRYLFTFLLVTLSINIVGQTNQNFNPDYNGDGFIGVDDILGVLSTYDTVWDGQSGVNLGCTYSEFLEYDSSANTDDGTCQTLITYGCTDPSYIEYTPEANTDDGTCLTFYPCDMNTISYQGYDYEVLRIGDLCWFAENLRSEDYYNGDQIPSNLGFDEWPLTTAGATALYGETGEVGCENSSPEIDSCDPYESLFEYGRLYNWFAVDDSRGLCPSGWSVPTDEEWTTMIDELGGDAVAGGKMKTTYGWSDGGNGSNESEFSGLPGGGRHSSSGEFYNAGLAGLWWSSSTNNGSNSWFRGLLYANEGVARNSTMKQYGFSVRCVRDAQLPVIFGCIDPAYLEYDPAANTDDGSCNQLLGCEDGSTLIYQGTTYNLVTIGNLCWFADNLRSENYDNGDLIPANLDDFDWYNTTSGATAIYGEDTGCGHASPDIDACDPAQSLVEYGRLYNWYAVDDGRGLCPNDWHVPTDEEWDDMIDDLGGSSVVGDKMKMTYGWADGGNGSNESGFAGLPGGSRNDFGGFFGDAGEYGNWWDSSGNSRRLYSTNNSLGVFGGGGGTGCSVRCVKD